MWTENDDKIEERVRNGLGAVNSVANYDDRIAPVPSAAAATPSISNLNVNNSKKVHIGPKFVSVTQNVQNQELVKELPFHKYLWDIVKNSSRTERLSCAVAVMVLITCIALIVYFTGMSANTSESPIDKAPHEWRITREMWLARPYNYTNTLDAFEPLMLVIFQHTVSPQCSVFKNCAAELRNLQGYFISHYDYDIPYNFLVGNDGRVYEGRGWNIEGAHTFGYNRCSIGIGFIGDYRGEIESHSSVTETQLNRTRMLLEEGVRLGHLRKDFLVIGAKDLGPTASPGSILNNALKQWPNYDHKNRFYKLNCEKMEEKFGNTTLY
ncbi:peptidoglycan-recognition protein SD isoform X4 [Pieris rapae]|uniref:peptidoglycan-recognition protein SD isoform X4 n=1 Tax=Pieris rapae TaxID=64459 RepID=UPI000B92856A|nr:peptidoglycan-recognition protein SD isoform X4 [Pieris rapae]